MIRALWTSASGMSSQQLTVDSIAHNLSNVNTVGFKRSRVELQDLSYTTVSDTTARPLQLGHGVKPAAVQRCPRTGSLQQTGGELDLAIEGRGYFQVKLPSGDMAYTRDGTLHLDHSGNITTSSGYPLVISSGTSIPADATEIQIASDGRISARVFGSETPQEIGQILLADFQNAGGLEGIGENLFKATDVAGNPGTGEPGIGRLGRVLQGYLEMSNVEVVQEMVDLIMAQRAYELNSKVLQSADEMLGMANNLRR